MTAIEQELLTALTELDRLVKAMSTASPKPDLLPLFGRIDGLALQLPEGTDPAFRHYLERKSFEKARLWLEGREAENQAGSCGH